MRGITLTNCAAYERSDYQDRSLYARAMFTSAAILAAAVVSGALLGIFLFGRYGLSGITSAEKIKSAVIDDFPSVVDFERFMEAYYNEAKILIAMFIAGFTVLAGTACAAFEIYKGVQFGYTVSMLAYLNQNSLISQNIFITFAIYGFAILAVCSVMAAKAMVYRTLNKRDSSDIIGLIKSKNARVYACGFLLLAWFMLIAVLGKGAAVFFFG